MEEEKKGAGFVVKDRRHFDEAGEARTDEEQKTAAPTSPPEAKQTPPLPEAEKPSDRTAHPEENQQAERQEGPGEEEENYPAVDFLGFIMSLSTTAMFHFGDFPDPSTGATQRNLSAAKQTVDILGMLREKTEGNLAAEEKRLLDGILFELRMRYVKEKGRQ